MHFGITKETKKWQDIQAEKENTSLSEEVVSISTLNLSVDATFSAILCFSADTVPKKQDKSLDYHMLRIEEILLRNETGQQTTKKHLPAFFASLAICSSKPEENSLPSTTRPYMLCSTSSLPMNFTFETLSWPSFSVIDLTYFEHIEGNISSPPFCQE